MSNKIDPRRVRNVLQRIIAKTANALGDDPSILRSKDKDNLDMLLVVSENVTQKLAADYSWKFKGALKKSAAETKSNFINSPYLILFLIDL